MIWTKIMKETCSRKFLPVLLTLTIPDSIFRLAYRAGRRPTLLLNRVGLSYHSPHEFRHGHIQSGMAHSKTVADFKAVSSNVLHSSMDITNEVYSQLGDDEICNRINGLNQAEAIPGYNLRDEFALFQEFLAWQESKRVGSE